MSRGIFISYRRDDSSGYAGRIFDHLRPTFSRDRVFMDVDNIELGMDFVEVLTERVGSCDALLAIIGRDWLHAKDAQGRRRLDDPHDFVRIEIEAALKRNTRVVPVLVEGATMPAAEDLPEPLRALARRQGLEISHSRFESDVELLVKALARVLDAAAPQTPEASTPASAPAPSRDAFATRPSPSRPLAEPERPIQDHAPAPARRGPLALFGKVVIIAVWIISVYLLLFIPAMLLTGRVGGDVFFGMLIFEVPALAFVTWRLVRRWKRRRAVPAGS